MCSTYSLFSDKCLLFEPFKIMHEEKSWECRLSMESGAIRKKKTVTPETFGASKNFL